MKDGLPADLWEKAVSVVEAIDCEMWGHDEDGRQISWGSARLHVARAILAERERCAAVARQYITDVGFPRAYADKCASEIMEASQ